MTTPNTQCFHCKNFDLNDGCVVFGKKIPFEIFANLHNHVDEFKGDEGIRFELIKADNYKFKAIE